MAKFKHFLSCALNITIKASIFCIFFYNTTLMTCADSCCSLSINLLYQFQNKKEKPSKDSKSNYIIRALTSFYPLIST